MHGAVYTEKLKYGHKTKEHHARLFALRVHYISVAADSNCIYMHTCCLPTKRMMATSTMFLESYTCPIIKVGRRPRCNRIQP
jgi:hypothetical protein